MLQPGDVVRYVPEHVKGDPGHKDCETGIITRINRSEQCAYVRYFRNSVLQSTPEKTSILLLHSGWGDSLRNNFSFVESE